MSIRNKAKKNVVSTQLSDMKITIAGRPKVGKTSLFYEILKREGGVDTGLLLAFEKGYSFLPDINVVDIESWKGFVEVVDDLVDDAEGYKFIAIDTVDIAGKLCTEYVLRKQSAKDSKRYEALADMPFGKAYELLETEFSTQMTRLEQAGFGIFYITHDKDKQIEEKNGMKYDKVLMSVAGRVGDYVKNSSDFLVFIDIEKEKVREGKTNKIQETRQIRFRGDGTTEAGGRIVELPETIPYDVDLFLTTISDAVQGQVDKLRSTTGSKTKAKATKKEVIVEEIADKEDSIDNVKNSIQSALAEMDKEEKVKWAKAFKERLGMVDYSKSDDVKELTAISKELSK